MNLPSPFLNLAHIYEEHGFNLYLVGGSTRDFLLNRPFLDFDCATDALIEEEEKFLPPFKSPFAIYGSISLNLEGYKFDITTLREESDYDDFRHPRVVRFVKDPFLDAKRRDFTINALYLKSDGQVLDYYGGLDDLKNKVIRFIGDPFVRVKEDPLRILRAERFADNLGFSFAEETKIALEKGRYLLKHLNPAKIQEEMRKRSDEKN